MREFIKNIWLLLFIIFVMGLFTFIPIGKYQSAYFYELNKLRTAPQKRIDATYKYIEAIENGYIDTSGGVTQPPREYYEEKQEKQSNPDKPYSRPLYIRDKNNPRILHPFSGKYP